MLWSHLGVVALGGALGASCRYLIALGMSTVIGAGFPWATLLVNVLGSFCLGIVYALSETSQLSPELKSMIGVGFLGALTTFSTFANETLLLFQQAQYVSAGINLILNLIICLFAVYLGQQLILSRV